MEYALELNDVSKTYKNFKLDHISLKLPKGSIMGFVGENGSGKSTTIKLITDIIKKETGKIYILGKDNNKLSRVIYENIGVVLDECCVPENLNIKDINKVLSSIYKTWDSKKFYDFIVRFQLPKDKVVKDFSKGMKMKLSIAVALSHATELLILDEATSGLDPIVRDEILDVFLEFIQEESHSILMSSHIISDLEKVCDYICFIHKGNIIFTESKDDLLERYKVLKCSLSEFNSVNQSAVIGYRKNSFGVEALVLKDKLKGNYLVDEASIEDIMLFYIKGEKQ
ncbi:ABC transporter ATP-binding protein [Clostridium sp. Marseille-P299]|uniref:ABC transporter ATP-binding protein n=1 Tax=Clostridium sp. Marseille-P299 TaxID=1805477 RepID=UPI00082C5041|nr:ABC transporter ATP-binding protein [Clostridium sp. Marseille-P299]